MRIKGPDSGARLAPCIMVPTLTSLCEEGNYLSVPQFIHLQIKGIMALSFIGCFLKYIIYLSISWHRVFVAAHADTHCIAGFRDEAVKSVRNVGRSAKQESQNEVRKS